MGGDRQDVGAVPGAVIVEVVAVAEAGGGSFDDAGVGQGLLHILLPGIPT